LYLRVILGVAYEHPDTTGLLLCASHEWPTSRSAAEQRNELAALQLTELHPLPQTRERQDSGLASIKSGLAAVRDFALAGVRSGSKPESFRFRLMSASTSYGHTGA
jgi:hypothetical protein